MTMTYGRWTNENGFGQNADIKDIRTKDRVSAVFAVWCCPHNGGLFSSSAMPLSIGVKVSGAVGDFIIDPPDQNITGRRQKRRRQERLINGVVVACFYRRPVASGLWDGPTVSYECIPNGFLKIKGARQCKRHSYKAGEILSWRGKNNWSESKQTLMDHLRDHTYTELRPSPVNGIGVFALRPIPEGTHPFCTNSEEIQNTIDLTKEDLEALPPFVVCQIK